MSKYRKRLAQLGDRVFLTDGELENALSLENCLDASQWSGACVGDERHSRRDLALVSIVQFRIAGPTSRIKARRDDAGNLDDAVRYVLCIAVSPCIASPARKEVVSALRRCCRGAKP